jgi:superfamily II DNA or RNA helicase
VAGDYHEAKLSAKMQEGTLTADVVQTWLKFANWRPTLCYAVDLLHARKLQAQFAAAGVPCAYIDADTKEADTRRRSTGELLQGRKTIKKDFHSGAVKVVVSVGTMTTGIDWDVRCISLVRPTKSEMLFTQIMGRGLRTAQGKDYCLVLDHSDNHQRLGFVTDIDASHVTLDDGKTNTRAAPSNIRLPKECPQCAYLKPPGQAKCPVCTFVAEAHSKIEPTAGELAELKRKAKEKAVPLPSMFLAELKCYAQDRHYKPGWPAAKFKDKFGHWPDRAIENVAPALTVSRETASWIKSRNIAWIKSKAYRFQQGSAKHEQ